MESILNQYDLMTEQSGACTGEWPSCGGALLESFSPIDGSKLGTIRCANENDYQQVVAKAQESFLYWRTVPAPQRGDIVRQIGNALREHKKRLGALVSLEMGKIKVEGEGEVQEMIDIADFAVGQSRMLYGLSMHSERPGHRMYEQWHPLGPIGVITAFNFPVAVWSWNALLALIAGDTVIWKPSSKTPLTSIAVMKIARQVLQDNGMPEGILNMVIGTGADMGKALVHDSRLPLISATGSVRMGRQVAKAVASRLGRSLLELGGNNAIIVTSECDLNLSVQAILFGAVGTAGQRCTTTRRVIVQKKVYQSLVDALIGAYKQIKIGHPLEDGVLMGPLIDQQAVTDMQTALQTLQHQGGRLLYGGEVLSGGLYDAGTYVSPCICAATADMPIVSEETFAPILYIIPYTEIEDALAYHNAVPQGLSSAIFTNNLCEAETFLSARGSDCGIANVNIGTSGAEIGGAFGGEKDTGGGREAGSESWKAYMRRQTTTINWSGVLPLAQGIEFNIA